MADVSVIAANHRVVGTLSAAEDLVIHGRVEGRIQSEATVVISESAIIEASIVARHVLIKGIVVGDVSGVDGIEIAPGAQVAGDLRTRRLALRAGARVAGELATGVEVQAFSLSGRAQAAASNWSPPRSEKRGRTPAFSPSDEVVEHAATGFPADPTPSND